MLYGAKLIARIKRTPTVESFRFLPETKIDFVPGQFLQLILDPADKEMNKYLSFSSSPAREHIEVSKRLSESKFSQGLKRLGIGSRVSLNAPLGTCVFKEEYQKIGFLIGGIGITPVISIIEHIVEKKLNTDVCLVYSNRTEEEIAFKQELDAWRNLNPNLKVSYLVTDCQPKDSACIFGRVDAALIKSRICDIEQRIVFIFGPPKMVEALQGVSLEAGARKENIKTENFIGY